LSRPKPTRVAVPIEEEEEINQNVRIAYLLVAETHKNKAAVALEIKFSSCTSTFHQWQ